LILETHTPADLGLCEICFPAVTVATSASCGVCYAEKVGLSISGLSGSTHMGKPRDGAKERYWRRVLRRQASSGLGTGHFCQREGKPPTWN